MHETVSLLHNSNAKLEIIFIFSYINFVIFGLKKRQSRPKDTKISLKIS